MSLAHVSGQDLSLRCVSNCAPIVFVVDNVDSVRESLDLLIRCEGWQPETFESPQEFLARPRLLVPSCLVLDVSLPGASMPSTFRSVLLSKGLRCRSFSSVPMAIFERRYKL